MQIRNDIANGIVRISDEGAQLVAITADDSRGRTDVPLQSFLRRMREAFDVDVVFVSQFVDGNRVIRAVDCDPDDEFGVPEGASDPLEASYCFHVAEGRLPQVIPDTSAEPLAMAIPGTHKARVGSHLSVPIIGPEGKAFGTVCCFSHEPDASIGTQVQLEMLKTVAALLADTFAPELPGRYDQARS